MKKNKYLALASAVLGVAVLGGGASAATNFTVDGNKIITNTDTITVNNVEGANDTFKACRIINIKYDSTSNAVTYEFTSSFQNFLTNSGGATYSSLTIEDYMDLTGITDTKNASSAVANANGLDGLAALLASNNYNDACTNLTTDASTHKASANGLQYGAYIIIPTSHADNSKAYGAMIANIGVKQDGNDYVVDTSSATLYAKVGDTGATTKTSKNGQTTTDTFASTDTITYTLGITAPVMPTNATNRSIEVLDTMEAGLEFVDFGNISSGGTTYTVDKEDTSCTGGAYCIKNGGTKVGYVTQNGSTLTYHFNDLSVTPSPITIDYTAQLTNNASLGNVSGENSVNENTVSLKTPTNYYDTNSSYTTSDPTTHTVYTYGLRIKKFEEDEETPLAGAKFDICADANCNTVIASVDMSSVNTAEYKSLAYGTTYYLKETQAPTGYKLLATSIPFTVQQGDTLDNGYYNKDVVNEEARFSLPFTGGRGVIIYAIVGVGIVGIASVYYYRKKKNEA